jgi:membrane-associated protein
VLSRLLDALIHLDQTLSVLATEYGAWIIGLLFLVIFAETGLVIFPLLPGDSLLFLAGTVAAASDINVHLMVLALVAAAIVGDSINYAIGSFIGPRVFNLPRGHWLARFIRREYLEKTQAFYRKYGGFTIIIGRFVPIVRTFAPFLAGVAQMSYARFLAFNVVGGILWVGSLTYAGYFFGNLPWVKDNLSLIVIGIVLVSVMPIVGQFWKEYRAARTGTALPTKGP